MIKITIDTKGEVVFDSFIKEKSTLLENAITLRRLEEIKQKLLDIEYGVYFEEVKMDE